MEEAILRWVNALGFPICTAVALSWALIQIFKRWERAVESYHDATTKHADKLTELSVASNAALAQNTEATRKLTDAMGSDPKNLCQAAIIEKAIRQSGLECRADELKILIARALKQDDS